MLARAIALGGQHAQKMGVERVLERLGQTERDVVGRAGVERAALELGEGALDAAAAPAEQVRQRRLDDAGPHANGGEHRQRHADERPAAVHERIGEDDDDEGDDDGAGGDADGAEQRLADEGARRHQPVLRDGVEQRHRRQRAGGPAGRIGARIDGVEIEAAERAEHERRPRPRQLAAAATRRQRAAGVAHQPHAVEQRERRGDAGDEHRRRRHRPVAAAGARRDRRQRRDARQIVAAMRAAMVAGVRQRRAHVDELGRKIEGAGTDEGDGRVGDARRPAGDVGGLRAERDRDGEGPDRREERDDGEPQTHAWLARLEREEQRHRQADARADDRRQRLRTERDLRGQS